MKTFPHHLLIEATLVYGICLVKQMSHLLISIAWEVDERLFVLHVDCNPRYLWQHVLEVPEVSQQVHNCVTNLIEHRLAIADADQWTRII